MRNKVKCMVSDWEQEAIRMQGKIECLKGQGMILEAAAMQQRHEFFKSLIKELKCSLTAGKQTGWCNEGRHHE